MLRYQLNPHFLFNTLNSISTLVLLKQTERANAMLARLSSFLRYTLVNEPTAQVTLAQEVETLKLYLEIEKMRFEDRLRPHFRDRQHDDRRAPAVAVAPAAGRKCDQICRHPKRDRAPISGSRPSAQGQGVRIEVADSGAAQGSGPSSQFSTGVGLANIKDRLAQAYGAGHGFTTKSNDHGGFSVIIDIPLDERPAEQ